MNRTISGNRWVLCLALLVACSSMCRAARLDEMSLDRWKKLREVERYQLNIAEKYYREKNYKVALAEYEKFLTLYETSEGASYSQLKWSLCQIQLKKINTAIKEGFQSVIDYWPDSPEAIAAGYFIGRAYRDIGETRKARKAYESVLQQHPDHLAAVYSAVDLIELTRIRDDDKDAETRLKLWRWLTFDAERNRDTSSACTTASQQLALHLFQNGAVDDAVQALQTTYDAKSIIERVSYFSRSAVNTLTADEKTQSRGEKLADQTIAWIRRQIPSDRSTREATAAARDMWFHMVDVEAASRRPERVVALYQQILKQFGNEDATLGRLGDWYRGQGRFDDARRIYAQFSDKKEGTSRTALSYRQQRQYPSAVEAYQRNLTQDAEHALRWQAEIAQTWREAGRYPEAIAVYEELYKADPEHAEQWRWMVAICYRDARKYKEAIGNFRQSNRFPSNYQEMAACHRALKQYGEAIVLYRQIISGAPAQAAWATLQIGFTYEESSRRKEAINAFQTVCRKYPKDPHASRAHAHLQTKYRITVTLGGAKDE